MATVVRNNTKYSNPYINALVSDRQWTKGDTLTYYLDPGTGGASTGKYPTVWENAGGGAALEAAAKAWMAVTNITFERTMSKGSATFVESIYQDAYDGILGEHTFPMNGQGWGRYNAGQDVYTKANNRKGGDSFQTFVHELGHALGLNHPHDGETTFPGVSSGGAYVDGSFQLNRTIWSVMSYNYAGPYVPPEAASYGGIATPMAFDIAAVQALYGANMSTAKGNDVYTLPTINGPGTFFSCIWDTGGFDTISAAGATEGATIDLRAATLLKADGGGGWLSKSSYVSGGFTIANGVTIEKAIGSRFGDFLRGNDADNILVGDAGGDYFTGGAGADTFVIGKVGLFETDYIRDFKGGVDILDISAARSRSFRLVIDNYYTVSSKEVTLNLKGGTCQIDVTGTLKLSDIVGGTCEGITIYGNYKSEKLIGTSGEDFLHGNEGNDTLTGEAGNDHLFAGEGRDTLVGGIGNDAYSVIDAAAIKIVEAADQGRDTVYSQSDITLAANVENLVFEQPLLGVPPRNFVGTGNAGANAITGLRGDDVLYGLAGRDTLTGAEGDDVLDGGSGEDVMVGGEGDDTFFVDQAKDAVIEIQVSSEGLGFLKDRVLASVSYTLPAHVELLELIDDANINGTGNAADNKVTGNGGDNKLYGKDGADRLYGSEGDDVLDGGLGADRMEGGIGDDVFVVDNAKDVVFERSKAGHDGVRSSVSLTLAANVEDLALTGIAKLSGTGNTLANAITGNDAANTLSGLGGDDVLRGGKGVDTLTGGSGADRFAFNDGETGASTKTADRITDFSAKASDRIDLSAVDARAGGRDNAFEFIGRDAFSGNAGELRFYTKSGAGWIAGDTDGDKTADLLIRVDGVTGLVASDFVL